jgi:alkylation response protein AidB-like acyl-CoA dehydrogenase
MDVRLSPEQRALRDATAQMVERLGPKAVGQLDDRERADKLEAAMAATGWRELRVDDEGGPLASGVEVAVVAGETGRGLADVAYVGPLLAADLRRIAGLPPAERPETVLLAPSMADIAVVAGDADAVGVALDAAGAEVALALVDRDGDLVVASVDLATPDVEQVDLTRSVTRPTGPAVVVEGGRPVDPGDLDRWRALALAATAADLVGVMQGAVDLSTAYASERRQYGAAIGSFQAVQHLLADALVATEGSRSTTLHAAWAVDVLDPSEALAAAATAKAYASRAARKVCETAIQVHGGIGNTWECLAHVFLRRALLSIDAFGGAGPNLDRVLAHQGIGGN